MGPYEILTVAGKIAGEHRFFCYVGAYQAYPCLSHIYIYIYIYIYINDSI